MVGPLRFVLAVLAMLPALAPAAAKAPPPAMVSGGFTLPDRAIWAGEVFDLAFVWRVDWSAFGNLDGDPIWDAAPLIAEPWTPPALTPPAPGESAAAIRFTTHAMALRPGTILLRPFHQTMIVRTGTLRTADYERAITEPVEAAGASARLAVRALPPAPPGFSGAVGQFGLTGAVTGEAMVGKALSWSLTLAGTGNWPALQGVPPRRLSRVFDLMGEPQVKEEQGQSLFDRKTVETLIIIPRRPGPQTLGPVEMPVFDPAQGRYVLIRAPAITLDIRPAPGQAAAAATPAVPKVPRLRLPPPLRGSGAAAIPMRGGLWRLLIAVVPAALLCLWAGLVLGRAVMHDPARRARRARRLSLELVKRIAADAADRRFLLRQWQHAAARALRLGSAAPVPASFADPRWQALWAEADHALYGPSPDLPADWCDRAGQLCAAILPPPSGLRRFFGRASVAPSLSLLALLLAAPGLAAGAGAAPPDWIARYNHALTLARQQQWEPAAAESLAAWAQNPGSAETRALARLALGRAGVADAGIGPAGPGDWIGWLTGQMSAAAWQWLVLAAVWAAGVATAALIVAQFRGRRIHWPILSGIWAAALLAAAPGLLALERYGPLADPDAAIATRAARLHPLPVEVPGDDGLTLGAGQVMTAGRSFLGWRQVTLGRRTGWIRESALTPVFMRGDTP